MLDVEHLYLFHSRHFASQVATVVVVQIIRPEEVITDFLQLILGKVVALRDVAPLEHAPLPDMVNLKPGFVPHYYVFGVVSKLHILDLVLVRQFRNESIGPNFIQNALNLMNSVYFDKLVLL